jgi:hypothetical protein
MDDAIASSEVVGQSTKSLPMTYHVLSQTLGL